MEHLRRELISIIGIRQDTSKKIYNDCMKKVWIGLIVLKVFLQEYNRNKGDMIDKNSLKYLLKRQGILLNNTDIESICDAFDSAHSDYFNFF